MLKPGCGSGIRCFFDPFIRDWGWKKNLESGFEILDEHLGSETLAQTSKFIHFKVTFQTLL